MNIRTRLRALILVTLVPLAVAGLGGAYYLVEKERAVFEQAMRDRVRALITAIDAELYAVITPLEVLGRSPVLARGELDAFRAEAQRALEARRGEWVNVIVSSPETGQVLMSALYPRGSPLPPARDPATVLQAARTGRPTVSRVAMGNVSKRPVFGVRVPVEREGEIKYVLSALVEPAIIARVVDAQNYPSGWASAIIDGSHGFVVRRPHADLSRPPSDSLRQALESAPEGFQRGRLLDGSEIYRAHRRSAVSDWSASIAVPSSVVDESLRGMWLLMFGFALVAALGLWVAWRLAARISQPIAALAAAAPALGRGEASALPEEGPLEEVQELSRALGDAAQAVRDREERQRQAEQALRAADRAKDEFLAMLGHELRNPLASVSNAAHLLRIARDQPEVLQNVSEILARQVEHMTRLVDDLLEVGRVTGGKVRLERAPLNLGQAASEVVATWKSGERFRHHRLEAELDTAWVSADRARIEQVLSNLLDNALKYTPAGGTIRVAVRAQGERALLEVSDDGEGIPPELIGRMFDLFVQGERGLARQRGGLGIGLTMAKRLVELHGGTIRAASAGPGRGATITVELPGIEAPALRAADEPAPMAPAPRRVLVIEDNADGRETLAALLRLAGHEVHAAENGARGLEAAARLRPHLALVDIGLPDIDGYEVARRLRRDPANGAVRLVALTGYGMAEDRRRAIAAGFDEHLAKPVDLAELEALLRASPAAPG